jgi:hypothetical protein
VIEKFKTMQMVDVKLPTTDGRELTLSRYTQPEPEHRMLLEQLRLNRRVNRRRRSLPRRSQRRLLKPRCSGDLRVSRKLNQ